MTYCKITIRYPNPVAPRYVSRGWVRIRICRTNISHGGKDHGIKSMPVHPILKIDSARFLKAAQTVGEGWYIQKAVAWVGAGVARVVSDVILKTSVAIRQAVVWRREDLGPVNIG
jgi:hypothetical protein